MRQNREIRVPNVRLIDEQGNQVGVVPTSEALKRAEDADLDLVEVVPNAQPPVCKILNYGKFRYDQTKREKEQKKGRHQIKVKEVKMRPNTDRHDLETKCNQARKFLEMGNKVKVTCMFRGRENAHPEVGFQLVREFTKLLEDVGTQEVAPQKVGRTLSMVIAPKGKKS